MACTECGKDFAADADEFGEVPDVCQDCQREFLREHVPEAFADPALLVCCWCRKPIRGIPRLQGGSHAHPCHRKCLVEIRRGPDGGI